MNQEETSCIFCKIVVGELPSSTVYEDDKVVAFLDIRPINPGHTLIIPKQHAPNLAKLGLGIGGRIFKVGMKIASALRRSGLRCEGVNLWLADGKAAGQDVFHVHLHVIPRFTGDGFRIQVGPEYGRTPPQGELVDIAGRISQALKTE